MTIKAMRMTRNAGDPATAVIIAYRKNRLNNRLIFGAPNDEIRRGWHRKLAIFTAGHIFGYERWRGDKYGTQDWTLVVCEAVNGGAFSQIPGVMPGANLLLHTRGKTKTKRALRCFDALKQDHPKLENVPVMVWRDLHHRLLVGQKEIQIIDDFARGVPC